jgi:Xaa-Pro aminopeptidase
MVLTIEPGLYIRAAEDIPEGFHDIGIRIEDDALVTETSCEILTAGVPTDATEIENLMAHRHAPAPQARN